MDETDFDGTHVEVCCIGSTAEAAIAVSLGASSLGLVSAMPSGPGVIPESQIREIAESVPGGVETFLLTSLTDPEQVKLRSFMDAVHGL